MRSMTFPVDSVTKFKASRVRLLTPLLGKKRCNVFDLTAMAKCITNEI